MAGPHALVQGPGFAAPTLGQWPRRHHPYTGSCGDGGGAIAGVVVDDDHFEGPEALGGQGLQQVGQGGGFVAGRNQHRNPGGALGFQRRQHRQA